MVSGDVMVWCGVVSGCATADNLRFCLLIIVRIRYLPFKGSGAENFEWHIFIIRHSINKIKAQTLISTLKI